MTKIKAIVGLMRPHQWIKNSFVGIGLFFSHRWNDSVLFEKALVTFFAFCLVSSGVYILNDWFDREQDRHHPQKKKRPLAAKLVSSKEALVLILVLWTVAFTTCSLVCVDSLYFLAAYIGINIGYSLKLKHVVILDVFVIASGFMLRILAGTLGIGIQPSKWLLMCGLMVTLLLGFSKRRSELSSLKNQNPTLHRKVLQNYTEALLDKMIGISSSTVIMSYCLYTLSPETLVIHQTENLIYTVPFVVFGIFRYMYLLHSHQGGGDTAKDIFRDPQILIAILGWFTTVLFVIR